jgi:hypothetical protein
MRVSLKHLSAIGYTLDCGGTSTADGEQNPRNAADRNNQVRKEFGLEIHLKI